MEEPDLRSGPTEQLISPPPMWTHVFLADGAPNCKLERADEASGQCRVAGQIDGGSQSGSEECQQPNQRNPVSGFDSRALAPSSKASLDTSNWKTPDFFQRSNWKRAQSLQISASHLFQPASGEVFYGRFATAFLLRKKAFLLTYLFS